MYCPMKLYIQKHVDTSENIDYQLALETKKLKIDISDLIQKNMRKIKKNMALPEIENALSDNINHYIESNAQTIHEIDSDNEYPEIIRDIMDNTYFNIKITALKLYQAMNMLDKDAFAIADMFFANCMYSYLLKDPQLELIGICDKVEIIDGKYYPVSLKSSKPPLKGVWDQDAIELVAHAILLEEEFDTEIFVGFVYYEKIDEKRPVVMDVNLRKGLFEVMREVKEITDNKKLPNIKKNPRKCKQCKYNGICLKD